MPLDSYESFLQRLGDELVVAIAEAENMGWHHAKETSTEWTHYQRILTWIDEIEARMKHYDHAKRRPTERQFRRPSP